MEKITLTAAVLELCEALDPDHQGECWPDPIAWDGRPPREQALDTLVLSDAHADDPCGQRGIDSERVAIAATHVRALLADLERIPLTTTDRIALGLLTTRDQAGRHFSEVVHDDWIERMEAAGLITIDRPDHPTGVPYGHEHWTLEVADEVGDWFDGNGVLIGYEDLYDETATLLPKTVQQVNDATGCSC